MKKTIETKIAKNGVKLYYVDGKRTSREVALQATADSRENLFTIEYATRHNAYFTGRILDATQVYESTSKAVLKELELKIDEYHGFTVKLHTIGWVEICKLFNKDYAKSLINKIENAFIRGEYGVKIDKHGKVSILSAPVVEPEPDDYAVNPDALEVAVNAETHNANTAKINDLKWEIHYTEGSINDLDKNHIAHAPNDQSLQERRAELLNELAALKAQLAEIEPDNTPQVDTIIQERNDARNEYDQLNAVRKVIEKDCERYERLRDRCKANSPKHKEYKQLLADFDPIIRAFEKKFIAAQNRYNQSLTLRTDEEKAATQKAIDEYNADLDARGIKYFATVYYYPNGIEGEDMETFCKECTSLNEANAFVSQEDHDGVYVGGIYDAGWEITDRNGNIVADHNTGIKEDNVGNLTDSALAASNSRLVAFRIEREEQTERKELIADGGQVFLTVKVPQLHSYRNFDFRDCVYTYKSLDAAYHFGINKIHDNEWKLQDADGNTIATGTGTTQFNSNQLNDVDDAPTNKPVDNRSLIRKWNEIIYSPEFKHETAKMIFTMQGRKQQAKIVWAYISIEFDKSKGKFKFYLGSLFLAKYDTPAQVDKVIDLLKAAITRGDKAFTFPTVDELIDPPELPTAKPRTLRDSINRAIKQCCKNRIGYLRDNNAKMEKYEYELMHMLQGARRELEVA